MLPKKGKIICAKVKICAARRGRNEFMHINAEIKEEACTVPVQTKEEILDKCIGIFAENGIENTAVSVICRKMPINPATLYKFFSSKKEIISECVKRCSSNIETELLNGMKKYENDIRGMGEFFFDVVKRNSKGMRFCVQVLTSPNSENDFNSPTLYFRNKDAVYSNIIAEIVGVDTKIFEPYFRLFLSVMYYYVLTDDEKQCNVQRLKIYELLLKESGNEKTEPNK